MCRLILFVFLSFHLSTVAASDDYVFTPIDGNDGLSGNKVRNITQLGDGRMVITTEGLVNIYDGSAFNYLHYSDKNSSVLSGYSGFHHDYVARDGYMWLKNKHRLFLIDINRERFVDNPGILLRSWGVTEPLSDFFMDKKKDIWLVTENDDLYYIPDGQKKRQPFLRKVSNMSGQEDQLYDLAVSDRRLYLFFRSGILICFDLKSRKELYRQQSLDQNQHRKYASTSFVLPGKGQFFQLRNGAGGGTMLEFDVKRRKWSTVLETKYWLNYLSTDRAGNMWIPCKGGMWYLNADLTRKEFIPQLKLVDGQVINTEVSTIYNDNQGGMWLGTLNRGLLYYHRDRFKFKNIGKSVMRPGTEPSINVSCFAEDNNGEILLGTRQGLFRYNEITGIVKPYASAGNLSCNALLRDKQNRIWIATNGQGLYCIDEKGKLCRYPSGPDIIYDIREHSDSTMYLSTNGSGYGIFNRETGDYQQTRASMAEAYNAVYQVAFLSRKLMAGVCSGGFFLHNLETGQTKLYPESRGYNALLIDTKKQIWLGSQDGLHLWDLRTGKRKSFYTTNGLINNYIQSIAESPDGAVWVSTSSGLSRITPQKDRHGSNVYSFSNFNRVDGVIANEFWERSVYISASGNIFWGGTDGFNVLPVDKKFVSKQTNVPVFVNFLLFNEKLESGIAYNGNVILKEPLPITKEIVLNHDQNFFTLEFSALNYINPTQTYYRYQLTGLDQSEREIQSVDGRGRANYTNLQPGSYYFRVRAANNGKDWTESYAQVKVVVKAPFWKSPLAYCFYVILFSGSVVLGVHAYLSKKRLKLVREQKVKLNKMKSAFLQNVNEELNEPLLQIIRPLNTILKHTDEGRLKIQLQEIQNNALDLKKLVSQLSADVLSPLSNDENELDMEVLLLNIRRLLQLQQERKEQNLSQDSRSDVKDITLSPQDEKLIQRALKYVEDNLDNSDYSVELLSRDMGMDRTGLYRKLVQVVGKTPSIFIRSVRIKRAALLLEEGFTVAEVADKVGFSTASYLTKCFQEEFGMKPSQYISSFKQRKYVQRP